MQWDPGVYDQFERERTQPFVDLMSRVEASSPRRVVDLGCGTGANAALVARRWPDAEVLGIDSSADMLAKAESMPDRPGNLRFEKLDISEWEPSAGDDVVVTNAALQWVPGSLDLIFRWCAALEAGAWFAMQVPHSAQLPSHLLLNRLARSDRWRPSLGDDIRAGGQVSLPAEYLELMLSCSLQAQAWETEYLHVLQGPDEVLEWLRGTSLRPVLARLDADDAELFEQQYSALLREAYPRAGFGTIYHFKRVFAVGCKR